MIRHEAGSVEQVRLAIESLRTTLSHAQIRFGSQCVVNRDTLLDALDEIEHGLPSSVTQATALIAQEKDILDKARREAAEPVR